VEGTAIDGTTPNRQFVRVETSTTHDYEVGGIADGELLRTTTVDPAYDQTYGYLTSTTSTVTNAGATETFTSTTVYTRPATPFSTPWCLDVPDVVQTTKTLPNAMSAVRKTRFYRNSANCKVTEMRDESDANLAKQLTTTFTYDLYGNVDVTTLDSVDGTAPDRSTDVNFDANGQFPTSITVGGVNLTGQATFNPLFGNRSSVTGPDGLTTSFLYDDFGRVTKETRPVGYTNFTYEDCYSCWPLNARMTARAQGSDGSDAYQFFDELQGPVGASWTLPQGSQGRQEIRYDALGRVWKTSQPYVYTDPTVYWVTSQYDLLGRLTAEDAPLSEAQPTGRTTTYDYRGLERWVTDDKSHTTKYVANAAGQIRQVIDALNHATSYTYKPFGELESVTDVEGNTTTIGYDLRGLKSSMTDPNMGYWSYAFNVFGELASQTNAASQTVSLQYDAAGRLDTRTELEGTTKFTYHASGVLGQGGKANEICMWSGAACLTSHKEKYTYDPVTGQPSQIRRTLDGTVYDFDFAFDGQGRLDVMSYPNISGYRFKVDYDYDAAGELSVAKDGNTGSIFYILSSADALGRDTFVTLGNGLTERRSFDRASGYLTSIDTGPNETSTIQDLTFTWDEVGNLATSQNALIGKTETFVYDALDRLDTAQVSGGGVLNDVNYSEGGRITFKTGVGNYTYTGGSCGGGPAAVKNANGQNYCYDANGRMTSHGSDTFEWYSYDLPKKLAVGTKTSEFSYGVGRDRYKQVQKTGSTTDATIYYAGTLFQQETVGATVTYRHYIPVRGRMIAQVSRVGTTNTVQYLHRDHQDSVVEVTSSSGALVQSLSFDAWGLRRSASTWAALASPFGGTEQTERGYTGHEHLDRVELIHMNGRVQDPVLGRFISADPFVQAPYHSQSLNRYSYVWNNPLTLVDPSGFGARERHARNRAARAGLPDGAIDMSTLTPEQAAELMCEHWDVCQELAEILSNPALRDDLAKAVVHEVCERGPELCPQQGGAIPTFSAYDDRSGGFAFARDAESRGGGGYVESESGDITIDGVPLEIYRPAFDAAIAASNSIDDSIGEYSGFFPGQPVPLGLDQFLPLVAFDGLLASYRDSFMTPWDFRDAGDGWFWNKPYRTTIFDVQFEFYGIKPGIYAGSDINYYVQGLLTARSWNQTMLDTNARIRYWNWSTDDSQQTPRALDWARAGAAYYDDAID
jgi:RHS repeat-associated protein